MKHIAQNVCFFTGKLLEFRVMTVGEDRLSLGRGILLLCHHDNEAIGQKITINCWGTVAERMQLLSLGSWVTCLTSYTPSEFRGKLQDVFTVGSFWYRGS